MKLTKKQIDTIRANTPKWLKGQQITSAGIRGDELGYFQKAAANWAYIAQYVTLTNSATYLVVTQFGEII